MSSELGTQIMNYLFLCSWIVILKYSSCQLLFSRHAGNDIDKEWNEFKNKFNKTYSDHHELYKKETWLANKEKIKKHNEEAAKGVHSYYLMDNNLGDLHKLVENCLYCHQLILDKPERCTVWYKDKESYITKNLYNSYLLGYSFIQSYQTYLQKMVKLTKSRHRKVESDVVGDFYHQFNNIPEEINWVDKGFVTPTYNQKDCGACYAFSIAGVVQGQIYKQTKKLVPLSSQQLVDCSVTSGNYGCGGGSLRNTLRYLEKAGGIMAYSDYPYLAKQGKCHLNKNMAIANITSWAVLPARDEMALEIAVANRGPVAVSINAVPHTFQFYHKGIYDDPACTSFTVNHAMLLVGYTKDAWILKNWWGKHWGEHGYMRLSRHKNRCGVANYAAYALV